MILNIHFVENHQILFLPAAFSNHDDFISGLIPNNSAFLDEHIAKVPSETCPGKQVYICLLCQKSHNQRSHAQNHVESIHFPNKFVYTCRGVIFS